jgi:hypothetical protein
MLSAPVNKEGANIKHARGRAHKYHEPRNRFGIPSPWCKHVLGIDVIPVEYVSAVSSYQRYASESIGEDGLTKESTPERSHRANFERAAEAAELVGKVTTPKQLCFPTSISSFSQIRIS